jgi:hypothetical protein
LERDHYISEAERQLKDTNFFKPLDYDPTLEFADKVSSVVEDMFKQGYVSEENKDYLIVPADLTFFLKYTKNELQAAPLFLPTVTQQNAS